MKFRDIDLGDRELFREYLERHRPKASEYTFTNFFVWADQRKHKILEKDDHLFIISEKEKLLYQPIGPDPAGMITEALPLLPGYHAGRIEEDVAKAAEGVFTVTDERDMHDYVYELESLRSLNGSKLRAKRNFVNRFEENDPVVTPLIQSLVPECLRVHEEWCKRKGCDEDPFLKEEADAVTKALVNFDELGVMGVAVLVERKAVAFAIAERLNDETYVDHFEKADTSYPGVFQFLNKSLAQAIPQGITYLNREQDLGVEGLRRAKKSYNPAMMIKKYSIRTTSG